MRFSGFGPSGRLLVILSILLCLVSCGDGESDGDGTTSPSGGGPVTTTPDFAGEYRVGVIGYDATGGWVETFDMTSDGDGSGYIRGRGFSSFSYSLSRDGQLTSGFESGQVSADSTMFHLVDTQNNTNITFGLKKSEGLTPAAMSGIYAVFGVYLYPEHCEVLWFDFEFDGAMTVTSTLLSYPADQQAAIYDVSDSGEFFFEQGMDGTVFKGQVSPDGNIFFCASEDSFLAIGVKKSEQKSLADCAGEFRMVTLKDDDVTDGIVDTMREAASVDDQGNMAVILMESSGTTDTTGNRVLELLSPDGKLAIDTVMGQLSPDNNLFIFGRDDYDARQFNFRIGIRTP